MLNDAACADLLTEMVSIRSESGAEADLAKFLAGEMERLGYSAEVDAAGNVVGSISRGSGPTVMLLGHIDTVAGGPPVERVGRLLYGRGTVDAKGPMAAFVCAGAAATWRAGRLLVVGAVGEETASSAGARHLLTTHDPDVVVIGEPSGCSAIVVGYKGRAAFEYSVCAEARHPARPELNAADLAVAFWNDVLRALGEDRLGSGFDRVAARIDELVASPTKATLRSSFRLPPGFDMDALKTAASGAAGSGTISFGETTEAVMADRNSVIVRSLRHGIRRHGLVPQLKVRSGTSDMNVVSPVWRVPIAAYGPGDAAFDHTDEEHLDLDELKMAICILSDALKFAFEEAADTAAPGPGRSA